MYGACRRLRRRGHREWTYMFLFPWFHLSAVSDRAISLARLTEQRVDRSVICLRRARCTFSALKWRRFTLNIQEAGGLSSLSTLLKCLDGGSSTSKVWRASTSWIWADSRDQTRNTVKWLINGSWLVQKWRREHFETTRVRHGFCLGGDSAGPRLVMAVMWRFQSDSVRVTTAATAGWRIWWRESWPTWQTRPSLWWSGARRRGRSHGGGILHIHPCCPPRSNDMEPSCNPPTWKRAREGGGQRDKHRGQGSFNAQCDTCAAYLSL